jgi:hypothetical protein
MTFYKQLPTSSEGRNFEIRQKVVGVYDKGKSGSVLETESLVVDKSSGETYVKAVGSMFFIGQGRFVNAATEPVGSWHTSGGLLYLWLSTPFQCPPALPRYRD